MNKYPVFICIILSLIISGCQSRIEIPSDVYELPIQLEGSLQNPAWAPDGKQIIFTRFRNGYNQGPADIFMYNLDTKQLTELVNNGADNINLPGSTWNAATNQIIYSSTLSGHDEIYIFNPDEPDATPIQVSDRIDQMSYEPSFSPDGNWIVFESHSLDNDRNGVIVKLKLDGKNNYITLTPSTDDCRQPNWSPDGESILYQAFRQQQWDIWIMDVNGNNHRQLSSGQGDKTDASFSPDGRWVVFSADNENIELSEIFIQSIIGKTAFQMTDYGLYAGAPSWSPIGEQIIFEISEEDPENYTGTKLWVLENQNQKFPNQENE